MRKELTDEWERRGVRKGQEFASLTDIITVEWAGMTTKQGGSVAAAARKKLELESGEKVVSKLNAKNLKAIKGKENKD